MADYLLATSVVPYLTRPLRIKLVEVCEYIGESSASEEVSTVSSDHKVHTCHILY